MFNILPVFPINDNIKTDIKETWIEDVAWFNCIWMCSSGGLP
jgi:hypothetical protein